MAKAAKRLNVKQSTLKSFFGQAKGRPAWLNRWLSDNGERLSRPKSILRIVKDGKRGRVAYVKLSDVRLIERAREARSATNCGPTQIVRNGRTYISVPEFCRRSGMNEMTVYYRIRRGMLPAIKKPAPKRRGIQGDVARIYVPVSQLKTIA